MFAPLSKFRRETHGLIIPVIYRDNSIDLGVGCFPRLRISEIEPRDVLACAPLDGDDVEVDDLRQGNDRRQSGVGVFR